MITKRKARAIRATILDARRFERTAPYIAGLSSGHLKGLHGQVWLHTLGYRERAKEMREQGDEIVRGLFYLIGWFCIGPFALAAPGGVTLGIPGVILGLALAAAIGVAGYWRYLRWHERKWGL